MLARISRHGNDSSQTQSLCSLTLETDKRPISIYSSTFGQYINTPGTSFVTITYDDPYAYTSLPKLQSISVNLKSVRPSTDLLHSCQSYADMEIVMTYPSKWNTKAVYVSAVIIYGGFLCPALRHHPCSFCCLLLLLLGVDENIDDLYTFVAPRQQVRMAFRSTNSFPDAHVAGVCPTMRG